MKCLGQLSLIVHNGRDAAGRPCPPSLQTEFDDGPFAICQDEAAGNLFVANLTFMAGKNPLYLGTTYNSKKPYPLVYQEPDGAEGDVFTDAGNLTNEFIAFVEEEAGREREDQG